MTAVDRFVERTRACWRALDHPEERWTALDPLLAELLADPDVVAASRTWHNAAWSTGASRTCCSTKIRTTGS